MAMASIYERVRDGNRVTFRPRGHSMTPTVPDRALVEVAPAHPERLEVGDVVLVRVKGRIYLHFVDAVDHAHHKVRIANARGHINGWAQWSAVAGLAVTVNGTPRPHTAGKPSDTA